MSQCPNCGSPSEKVTLPASPYGHNPRMDETPAVLWCMDCLNIGVEMARGK